VTLAAIIAATWLALTITFAYGWARSRPPKSPHEQRLEDDEQMRYLRDWRALRDERAHRTLTRDEEHA
jgi:hypothetical protein